MRIATRLFCLTAATVVTLFSGSAVLADDTEVFFGTTTPSATNNPNILLVLDTSGSMTRTITSTVPYNAATIYSGSCNLSRVYFRRSSSGAIDCTTSNYVPLIDFQCAPATTAFAGVGYYQDAGIRWRRRNNAPLDYAWSTTFSGGSFTYSNHITCLTNNGPSNYPLSGTTTSSSNRYNGTSAANYWNTGGTQTQYYFYSANYLNYLATGSTITQSRMQIVKNAASSLIDSVTGVNIGLMRYDSNGSGGMVIQPMQPVATGATALKTSINGMFACGDTPLSETLYEAYLYFTGGAVGFGNGSYRAIVDDLSVTCTGEVASLSVAAARTPATVAGTNYQTPIAASCQKNHIVFLTDGLAYQDFSANTEIEGLQTGTQCYSGQTSMWAALGVTEPSETHSGGLCLKPMAQYMADNDMSTTLGDDQFVNTHFIGFGADVAGGAAAAYLRDAARAGDGDAYSATNYAELTSVLQQIITGIKDDSSSFSSPSVAVNAFNKTQVLEDMYIAMFKPSTTTHWPGNVKKFKLRDSIVIGRSAASLTTVDSVSAVDPSTGFFTSSSKDFWHQLADTHTENTTKGGAANMIPAPASRTVYTYIGTTTPSAPQLLSSHPFTTANTAITNTVLAIGGSGDPTHDVLINWARGDDDGDLTTTGDARNEMGDPIHSQPAVVIYGTTGATANDQLNDALVFTATNDGYLHAIDVMTGTEQWAFIPYELLSQLKNLYADAPSATKHYSLDGDIRVLKYDVDGDGKVEPSDGDRVFLYFSQGRGGPVYYALDVTLKSSPKFAWSLGKGLTAAETGGPSELRGIVDKSWSTPTLGRVKVGSGSAQNSQRLVLIFGGGYDDLEESTAYNSADNFGNGLFIVDAVKGTVLWNQTRTASGAFARMTHAIPSNVTVLDTNSDGWTDRMYVGDMAGQVWRLDITNGNTGSYVTGGETTAKLVTGGVIASLGGKESTAAANNRSFYNPPDVAAMAVRRESSYYNIGIGSGDRGLPRTNNTVSDRFYSIRDYQMAGMTQANYNSYTRILDGDLVTINGASAASVTGTAGWKLELGTGEKSLAQSLSVDGVILFTTYLPPTGTSSTTSCRPSTGSARSYAIRIANAEKRFVDLYEDFNTSGLPTQISIVNEGQLVRTDGTTAPTPPTPPPTTCMSGVVVLGQCVEFGRKVKTFWWESGSN